MKVCIAYASKLGSRKKVAESLENLSAETSIIDICGSYRKSPAFFKIGLDIGLHTILGEIYE